jgi:hypothetical protein
MVEYNQLRCLECLPTLIKTLRSRFAVALMHKLLTAGRRHERSRGRQLNQGGGHIARRVLRRTKLAECEPKQGREMKK